MTSQEILRAFQAGKLSLEEAKKALTSIDISHTSMLDTLPKDAIAIVGMSGRYPDARNLTEYWDNLVQAKNSIREIPLSRFDIASYYDPNPARSGKIYCKWLGAIDEIEYFDPLFFHISPAEAEGMDPHQRLFLEEGYKAFEDAGYSPALLNHKACGVYLGIASSEYGLQFSQQKAADVDLIGSSSAITAARIAYTLNLKGPAIAIDTACSSSLVATHLACQALRTQEIDMALVGGVSLYLTPDSYVGMCNARMLSPDGQCKAFDASANGFVPGEGIGALVLKRLADAEADHDHIYGLIIGSGMNQDGTTNGITAPSANSQSELIREVYHKYHINPESINYVETHGTGTKLGDPIELEALASVFQEQTQRKQYCAIGSVKSNIGHTSAVSGLAGVQKVLLAIQQKKLVPTLHYQRPNPHFDFEASPFYVNTETQDWHTAMEGTARRAAVSSFGFNGTNVHLVIEEYIPHADVDPWLPRPSYGPLSSGIQSPQPGLERTLAPAGSPERKYTYQTLMSQVEMQQTPSLFVLSAKSEQQLKSYAQDVKRWIQTHQEFVLQDIAFTLQLGREAMDYRLAIVANSREILLQRLEEFVSNQASIGVYTAQVNKNTYESVCLEVNANEDSLLYKWCQEKNLTKIAQIWVQGVNVDWKLLYTLGTASKPHMTIRANPMITSPTLPYRVSLPTYPFARERYWIPATAGTGSMQGPLPTYAQSSTPISADAYVLHPLVQQNISNFFAQQFSSTFRGDEFFLADHVISGQHIMPAVAYLEMARAAVVAASGLALQAGIDAIRLHLRHVVWAHPLIIGSHHITVRITLFPQENGTVVFVINRDDAVGIIQPHSTAHCVTDIGQAQGTILTAPLEEEKVELVYCQGTIQLHSEDTIEARASQSLDLSAVQARCQRQISASECYQRYRELGLNYGPTYQAIEQLS